MKFWQGRKVLITGHTGFKGSWLSLVLQLAEADLVGLALPPSTSPNIFTLANVSEGMISLFGDIRNFDQVIAVFKQHQPEIVIHMAAQPLVRYSYKAPIDTYATNVMGTVHVLEAARQVGSVKAIVNVTTDKCYENNEKLWGYSESDRLGGYDPYSNSKACSELVTSAYRTSYFNAMSVGLASARAGNVIGGGDWAQDRLIPDLIQACMAKASASIRNPNALRPWQHVMEPLSGYLLLAKKLYHEPSVYADAWNFGPDEHDIQSVSWIADYIMKHWNESAKWSQEQDHRFYEATCLKLDSSKAKKLLGWQPCWNLEKGLQETVNWYQAFVAKMDMREKTTAQIKQFLFDNRVYCEADRLFETENYV